MPYYCTVPRCTSMAGKAANVSFHQFPRDRALAEHWNTVLRRGKPWTKYSKVCSLHFTPTDYTVTSVGKNKGQWRTLRKDAVPSQNLPLDSSVPQRVRSAPTENDASEQQMHQQLAQAVYMQTMLAVHAATLAAAKTSAATEVCEESPEPSNTEKDSSDDECLTIDESKSRYDNSQLIVEEKENSVIKNHTKFNDYIADVDQNKLNGPNDVMKKEADDNDSYSHQNQNSLSRRNNKTEINVSKSNFKCEQCPKCFIDPDVFLIHKRWHATHTKEQNDAQVMNKVLQQNINTVPLPDPLGSPLDPFNLENNLLLAMQMNMQTYIEQIMTITNHLPSKDGSIVSIGDNNMTISNNLTNDINDKAMTVCNNLENKNGNMPVINNSINKYGSIVGNNETIEIENMMDVSNNLTNESDNIKVSVNNKNCSSLTSEVMEVGGGVEIDNC